MTYLILLVFVYFMIGVYLSHHRIEDIAVDCAHGDIFVKIATAIRYVVTWPFWYR